MWPDFFSQGALEVRLPQTVASLQTLKNSKECYVCILRTFKIPFHSIVTLVPCSRLRFSLNGLLRLISRKCKILCHWIVTLASLAPLGFFCLDLYFSSSCTFRILINWIVMLVYRALLGFSCSIVTLVCRLIWEFSFIRLLRFYFVHLGFSFIRLLCFYLVYLGSSFIRLLRKYLAHFQDSLSFDCYIV